MATKLLAALNRITLEDVIRVRIPEAAAKSNPLNKKLLPSADPALDSPISEGRESPFDEARHCQLCKLKFNSEEQLGQHLNGKRHEKSLRRSNLSTDTGIGES